MYYKTGQFYFVANSGPVKNIHDMELRPAP